MNATLCSFLRASGEVGFDKKQETIVGLAQPPA
jgi:hypothetical protein